MLEKTDGLLLYELVDHVAKNGTNCVKALIRLANVCETNVIQQNLLHNEDSDCLAELRTCFHDTEAKGDNLGREEEVDDF